MKRLAIFDFDHTLITGDSFLPFLAFAAGRAQTYAALAEALTLLGIRKAQHKVPQGARSFLKSHLLYRLLSGKKRDALHDAAAQTRLWQTENTSILRRLHDHHDRGDTVLIASGGLNLYLPESLRDIPHDALICTDIGVENGVVTGDMINGNCVRQCKAERVASWMTVNGVFEETFAYGNYPHDLPMLNLVQHRVIVS